MGDHERESLDSFEEYEKAVAELNEAVNALLAPLVEATRNIIERFIDVWNEIAPLFDERRRRRGEMRRLRADFVRKRGMRR